MQTLEIENAYYWNGVEFSWTQLTEEKILTLNMQTLEIEDAYYCNGVSNSVGLSQRKKRF